MELHRHACLCFLSFFFFFFHVSVSASRPQFILQNLLEANASLSADEFSVHRKITEDDYLYCDSWRLAAETNNAGPWTQYPTSCYTFLKDYMTGQRYLSDCEAVANSSLKFAKSVNVFDDDKKSWIFDVDETLLSNLYTFLPVAFRSDIFDEQPLDDSWVSWVPPIPSSLKLYNELKKLKFKIFLLTGRNESVRAQTLLNLFYAGYTDFERLILRGPGDKGTTAQVYKSKKRKELEDEGYIIVGSSGDQWSDLIGYSVAKRSFKMPNPLYFAA